VTASGRVLVSGATGLVGTRLVAALQRDGAALRVLTRRPEARGLGADVEAVGWDGLRIPAEALADVRAIVHLAGEPVFAGRLRAARRQRIRASRIESTQSIVEAVADLPPASRPDALVCASAVGFYGSRGDERLDESAAPGEGFLADVCVEWERAAQSANALGVRAVSLRIGVVLAAEGGALARLVLPFRAGFGGRLGDGRQWFPWIHIDDLVGMLRAALRDERWRGPVNAVAPAPVTNAELTRTLGRRLRRPTLLPIPAALLRLVLGELAGELLDSRRVVPRAAQEWGFEFTFPSLDEALAAELR
jgi:uncharacterized protein (TIGR01777 family)